MKHPNIKYYTLGWFLRWIWYTLQGRCWECTGQRGSRLGYEEGHSIGPMDDGYRFCFRCDFMCRCKR